MYYAGDMTGLDYVGDDETGLDYVGDDESGARGRRFKMTPQTKAKYALASRLPQVFLGFDTTVAAAGQGTSAAEPNVHLRPTDLIVRGNAADFLITTMQVGRVNMIVGANGISAEMFGANIKRPAISSPKLQGGTNALLNLTNLTGGSSRFLASLVCLDVSDNPASP